VDMCLRLPADADDFLSISGVGQVKLERYGNAFLKAVALYVSERSTESSAQTLDTPPDLEPLNADKIETSDDTVTVSAIAERINCELLQRGIKKLTGAKINELLVKNGYLHIEDSPGNTFKTVTPRGEEIGITTVEREIRGNMCKINLFDRNAQRVVTDVAIQSISNQL